MKVAGIEYIVNEINALEEKHGLMGQVIYSSSEIELDDRLSTDRKEQIFIHELLHACFYEAGFEKEDEDVINRVSTVLYQVLKDNQLNFLRTDTE